MNGSRHSSSECGCRSIHRQRHVSASHRLSSLTQFGRKPSCGRHVSNWRLHQSPMTRVAILSSLLFALARAGGRQERHTDRHEVDRTARHAARGRFVRPTSHRRGAPHVLRRAGCKVSSKCAWRWRFDSADSLRRCPAEARHDRVAVSDQADGCIDTGSHDVHANAGILTWGQLGCRVGRKHRSR